MTPHHFPFWSWIGTAITGALAWVSLTMVTSIAQLVLVLVSICVGILTGLYTWEKRTHFKKSKR